ncbi:hypothetical protein M404DRAFT_231634 [Pisolithus tinctorius Marx 270]|uniref:Uncharacterized protein n=1 Tax=Pisolithus tinctorius Marx 270 TaxID=870435 RepID=A0A0C3PML8_PISTI|nr:hypothetical protein M404DRAFT_231634 [Pisolithus tinctorius Marx 270]
MRKPNPILTTGAQHKSDKDAGSDDRCLKVIECLEGLALDILEQMVASIIKPNNLTPHTTNAHGLAPFNNARYGRLEVTVSDRSKGGLDESRRVLRYPVRGSRTSSKHIGTSKYDVVLRISNCSSPPTKNYELCSSSP